MSTFRVTIEQLAGSKSTGQIYVKHMVDATTIEEVVEDLYRTYEKKSKPTEGSS
jgi:hypothetical protein